MKKTKFLALFFCLLTALIVTSCTESVPNQQTVTAAGKTVTVQILEPKEVNMLIQKNKGNPDFAIIDVRTPEEFDSGHIEGAININYHSDNFVATLEKLDKNKLYLVYCRTGRRSADTVSLMVRLGFTNILRFAGDIVRWRSEGLPLTSKQ